MNNWISIKEQIPTHGQEVLITNGDFIVKAICHWWSISIPETIEFEIVGLSCEAVSVNDVTHWAA